MQKFGIEIRKVGDTKNLYKDVDLILKRNGVESNYVSDIAKQRTVAHALQRMLEPDRYFDVCTIDSCIKVCSICIPAERYAMYRAVHCIHWDKMLPDYRQLLVAMVLDDFRVILCP